MANITLLSPAKVNLFLRILSRRPDGFHELASLFQTISLYDELYFEPADKDKLTCNWPQLPTDGSNLVLKAADLFRRNSGIPLYLKIHLEKRIPCEAGLGGGSGNAATTLWAMNGLTDNRIPLEVLKSWSAELGSDVAFFLSQGTAYCTGRGEKIQPVSIPDPGPIWIVKPQEGLSTKRVYETLKAHELSPRNPEKSLESHIQGQPHYYNDLEVPAFQLMPSLAQLKDSLKEAGCQHVLMSGSGTSFFCFGVRPPSLPGLSIHASTFTNRSANNWYGA